MLKPILFEHGFHLKYFPNIFFVLLFNFNPEYFLSSRNTVRFFIACVTIKIDATQQNNYKPIIPIIIFSLKNLFNMQRLKKENLV